MLRIPAIAVMVAMFCAPLALLVRGIVCDPAECKCMTVCPMHHSASASGAQVLCGSPANAGQAPMCGMHQGHHALDYGFIAPFAPTIISANATIASPTSSTEFTPLVAQSAVSGFLTTPFEPPRS
jgi:hypothetical protein